MPGRVKANIHYGWARKTASPRFTWDCPRWRPPSLNSCLFYKGTGERAVLALKEIALSVQNSGEISPRIRFLFVNLSIFTNTLLSISWSPSLTLWPLISTLKITASGQGPYLLLSPTQGSVWMIEVILKKLRVPWMFSLINYESEWASTNPHITQCITLVQVSYFIVIVTRINEMHAK